MTPDRWVLVTGAGGRLGAATVRVLAAAGTAVVAVGRRPLAATELPGGVRWAVADVTVPGAAAELVDRLAAELGPPAGLVNTVGAFRGGDALATTPEALQAMLEVNLGAALWTTQAVAGQLRRHGGGAIVHVAARNGLEPSAGAAAYGVSKAALVQLVAILDVELRPLDIRVNAVAPRLIDTPENRAALPAAAMAHAVTPEAIATVIAFLLGPGAAPISGAVLPVYGG